MTEAQFLQDSSAEFDRLAAEIDALLAKATEETWQATRPDNGWTTAQIVEHVCRAAGFYEARVAEALSNAPASDGSAEVRHGFFARMLLKEMSKKRRPAPKKLVVTEAVSPEAALEHWERLKKTTREEFAAARGKSLAGPRFPNPFVSIFPMSVADHIALQNLHVRYHLPQIATRLP